MNDLDAIASFVLEKIKDKYFLVERTSDLSYIKQVDAIKESFLRMVIGCVAEYFNIDVEKVWHGQGKVKNCDYSYYEIRAIVYRLCREVPERPISFSQIGSIFGGKNHATIMHAAKGVFDNAGDTKKHFLRDYEKIKQIVTIKSQKP